MTDTPIAGLTLTPYRLPLIRPWTSTRGHLEERTGWLVRVDGAGLSGYGDCAPLPAAGTEPPHLAWAGLVRARERLPGLTLGAALDLALATTPTPAADQAVECALLDLHSRLLGVPLYRRLAASPPGPPGLTQVPVNAVLGGLRDLGSGDLEAAWDSGTRLVKLKVGMDPPRRELARLLDLTRSLPPGLALRLDANGAWDLDTARETIAALQDLPIESLEEPLRHPTRDTLAGLQAQSNFPLALDESLGLFLDPSTGMPRVDSGGLHLPVRRAILKPGVLGGLRRTLGLARRLRSTGTEAVVTSLVESAAGLWAGVQLAAAIGSQIPQGLATAAWLATDLGPPPTPIRGLIQVPDRPGSGFDPHA